jgi:TPR repeat protein
MHLRGIAAVATCVAACVAPALTLAGEQNVPPTANVLAETRRAADQGDAQAQVFLGRMYFDGTGVPKDDVEAVRWWRLAAEQGDRNAQFHLSFMYEYGRGVPLDLEEAVRLYSLAAAQGDALAQFNLGRMYYTGQGVAQDYAEAARWWRLAAGESDLVAQFNLGIMYEQGRGVPQDDVRAYMWLAIAIEGSSGDDWVRRLRARDEVALRLTPERRAEADVLATECRASGFANCGLLQ